MLKEFKKSTINNSRKGSLQQLNPNQCIVQPDLGDYLCNSKSRCMNLINIDSINEFDLLSGNPVECVVHPDLWNKTKLWDPLGIGKNLALIFRIFLVCIFFCFAIYCLFVAYTRLFVCHIFIFCPTIRAHEK